MTATIMFNSIIVAILSITVLMLSWRVCRLEKLVKEQDEDICSSVDECIDNCLIVYANQLIMARDKAAKEENYEDAAKLDKIAKEALRMVKGNISYTIYHEGKEDTDDE